MQLSAEAVDIAKEMAREMALRSVDAVHLSSALLLQRRFAEQDD